MAKEVLKIQNLTAEKAKEMLGGFDYNLSVDKKGRLSVECKRFYFFISFKANSKVETVLKISGFKWKSMAYALFLGIIMMGFVYREQKKAFNDVINGLKNPKSVSSSDDIPSKIAKLKEMKDQGLINEDEFNKKKAELIDKM